MSVLQEIIPSAFLFAAPLIFTALGGVLSERSGIINIGLEGLMVMGAFVGIVVNLELAPFMMENFGSTGKLLTPWISILVAAIVSALFASLHAIATVTFRADQVVTGVAINFLALGVGLFLIKQIYGKGQTDMVDAPLNSTDIPLLSDIPFIGPIFFEGTYYTNWLAVILAFVVWYVIFKTPFGLRLRSVGEHPIAADTVGINVNKMRYIAVMLSGFFGGIGGSVFALTFAQNFSHGTISGQGFIALAAVVFGKWHPLGALGAAIFFGVAQSLSVIGSGIPLLENIPSVYLQIAPYVLTILALVGLVGRAESPKALGTPFIKGSR
ncbi:ABC transporter permease [Tenuibacillus multivorans]|uniref:Simple sugar transport system permease protein n=1 Tax=Tenuibacillus multivorans TaxID=237069 RepID=A0A1G9XTU9_9BACI|nr:ABC transporter permease [Tenuibacillus multivorans]GEL75815.1 ABC transporter permease [Tenuibacillus multivorans]SDN00242.1 simple sugar transport system permease protein [Tenuibacillus multivorans]